MKKIILNIIITLFIYSCSSTYGDEKQKNIEQKIPVRTKLLSPQKYVKKIKGTGKVISAQQANLMFEVPGKIVSVNCIVGQYVEKGDVIASLKNDVYYAKFQLAESAFNKANRDLKNIENLFKSNAVSEDQYLQAQLGQKNANSDFIAAKYAFESTELIAPFSGTITHINLQVGELFSPGPLPLPPVIISKMDDLQLEAKISSKEISSLKIGQKANISYPLESSYKDFDGIVNEVGFVPITMSNSYKIQLNINNPTEQLKLGMMMNFTVEVSEIDSVYLISNRYILDDKSGNYIWANENSVAKKIPVTTGDLVGYEMIIQGDLIPGMMVVTDGARQVKDGSKLKVVQ